MANYDFFLCTKVNDDDFTDAIIHTLRVDMEQVVIIDDLSNIVNTDNESVIVVKDIIGGEYEMYVSVYINLRNLEFSETEFVEIICKHLKNFGLIGTNDPNPYSWVRISPDGIHSQVLLKDEPLDERGEAVVLLS